MKNVLLNEFGYVGNLTRTRNKTNFVCRRYYYTTRLVRPGEGLTDLYAP